MAQKPVKKQSWSRPLADIITPLINPVLAKQGFGQSDILLNWDDIVGERLAAVCEPIKMQWPARAPNRSPDAAAATATLIIRVETGFALELQHLADILVQRINGHLGWRCVGKITLRQGPLERAGKVKRVKFVPDPGALQEAARRVEGVENEELRAALARLGSGILSRKTG